MNALLMLVTQNPTHMNSDFKKIVDLLKQKFGIEVSTQNSDPDNYVNIADFSGKKIRINADVKNDKELIFISAHLFGHMVQFSRYDEYRDLVEATEQPKPLLLSGDFKMRFYNYEREGYELGKGLIEAASGAAEAGRLDEQYQTYFETDFELYWRYLTTGKPISPAEFDDVLQRRYSLWRGRFKAPLATAPLPRLVDPQKGAVVY